MYEECGRFICVSCSDWLSLGRILDETLTAHTHSHNYCFEWHDYLWHRHTTRRDSKHCVPFFSVDFFRCIRSLTFSSAPIQSNRIEKTSFHISHANVVDVCGFFLLCRSSSTHSLTPHVHDKYISEFSTRVWFALSISLRFFHFFCPAEQSTMFAICENQTQFVTHKCLIRSPTVRS